MMHTWLVEEQRLQWLMAFFSFNRGSGSNGDPDVAAHPKRRDVELNHTHNVYGYHKHIAQTWMQTSLPKHRLRNPADSSRDW